MLKEGGWCKERRPSSMEKEPWRSAALNCGTVWPHASSKSVEDITEDWIMVRRSGTEIYLARCGQLRQGSSSRSAQVFGFAIRGGWFPLVPLSQSALDHQLGTTLSSAWSLHFRNDASRDPDGSHSDGVSPCDIIHLTNRRLLAYDRK